MTILNLAAEMSTQSVPEFQAQGDTDTLEFLKELREEILEAYQTIIISVEDSSN